MAAVPYHSKSLKKFRRMHIYTPAALDDADAKKGLKLLWFATGKDDFLLNTTKATVKMLESHGFSVVSKQTDGGHTWIVWREHYLPEFAQALFHGS